MGPLSSLRWPIRTPKLSGRNLYSLKSPTVSYDRFFLNKAAEFVPGRDIRLHSADQRSVETEFWMARFQEENE